MPKVSPKTIFYGLTLLAALAFLMRSMQATPPGSTRGPSQKTTVRETSAAPTNGKEAAPARVVQAAPGDADLKRYQVVIARNIFSPPAPPAPPLPKVNPELMKSHDPIVIAPVKQGPPPPPPPPSITGWTYAGYCVTDGITRAVIQNKNNTTAKFVARGEDFLGYKVESISGEQVVLTAGTTRVPLERPRDFSVVPLQGMAAQPTRQGGPGARMGMRGGGG